MLVSQNVLCKNDAACACVAMHTSITSEMWMSITNGTINDI